MTTNIIRPYTTPENYSYDSDLIEIVDGKVKLKDHTPENVLGGASYKFNINLTKYGGSKVGTAVGGASIVDEKLDLAHTDLRYVDHSAVDNFDSQQIGSIGFNYIPNHVTIAGDHYIFSICKASGDARNLIAYRDTGGHQRLHCYDENGDLIEECYFGYKEWVIGQLYKLLFCFDFTAGAIRMFIGGTQFGTTKEGTGTRNGDIGLLRVGGRYNLGTNSDFQLSNFTYYNNVQQIANYVPQDHILGYDTSNPTVKWNTSFFATKIKDLVATIVKAGDDAVKGTVERNSIEQYWDGDSAEISDGYAKTNDFSELTNDVLAEFTNDDRYAIRMVAHVHSADGSTTPELDKIAFGIDSSLNSPVMSTLVNLEGFIFRANQPMSGLIIKIRPYQCGHMNCDVFHYYDWTTLDTTDSNGHFSGFVYYHEDLEWEIKIGKHRYRTMIPDQEEVNITELDMTRIED